MSARDRSETGQRVREQVEDEDEPDGGPRVALVTGGAGGIGRGIAAALHARGLLVAVADLEERAAERVASELREEGGAALGVAMDVTDSASVGTAVVTVGEQLGAVDVLVNNAGWDELRPFIETDEAFWRRVVDVNYLGALRVTRAVLPGMIEDSFGRVVSISSDAARAGSSLESVYAGAKAALIGFTKSLAREVGSRNVRANVVAPGYVHSRLTEVLPEEARQVMLTNTPLGRLGDPEDIAGAVRFLCSDEASFITGEVLLVDGGLGM